MSLWKQEQKCNCLKWVNWKDVWIVAWKQGHDSFIYFYVYFKFLFLKCTYYFPHFSRATLQCKMSMWYYVLLQYHQLYTHKAAKDHIQGLSTLKWYSTTVKQHLWELCNIHLHDCYLFYALLTCDFSFWCLENLLSF